MKEQQIHSSLLMKPVEKYKSSTTFWFKCKGTMLLPTSANSDTGFAIYLFFSTRPGRQLIV